MVRYCPLTEFPELATKMTHFETEMYYYLWSDELRSMSRYCVSGENIPLEEWLGRSDVFNTLYVMITSKVNAVVLEKINCGLLYELGGERSD